MSRSEANRNWTTEAEGYLSDRFKGFCCVRNPELPATTLAIDPMLDANEAQDFLLGLEHNLFTIDSEGYVQSALLPHRSRKSTKQKMLQLFWLKSNGSLGLFREGLCQLATVSSLILNYGWPKSQIFLEPSKANFGPLAYAVDILIRDKAMAIVACGEVKRNQSEFRKLIEGFRDCCERGCHAKTECRFPKNHAKYAFCCKFRPHYFFAVAPGEQLCFKMLFSDDRASILEEHTELLLLGSEGEVSAHS